jgi:hypothetical protein
MDSAELSSADSIVLTIIRGIQLRHSETPKQRRYLKIPGLARVMQQAPAHAQECSVVATL